MRVRPAAARRRSGRDAARLAEREEVAGEAVREVHGGVDEVLLGQGAARRPAAAAGRAGRAGSDAAPRPTTRSRRPCSRARRPRRAARPARRSFRPAAARAERARDHHEVAGLRARRAAAAASPARAASTSITSGPGVRGQVAADDGHAGLRGALEQAVVEAVHEGDARLARAGRGSRRRSAAMPGHGRDVREVDGERLAPDEPRRTTTRAGSARPRPGCRW